MPTFATPGRRLPLAISWEGERAILTFHGVLHSSAARAIEEQLQDPRLRDAREWLFDMRALDRIDLVCAYALLRAASAADAPKVIIYRPNHRVKRILHHVGTEAVATFEV
ncbi:STAS domain-containing protein [Streptomyces sp. OZ13]|uniref:STAS domain-containing protein n=1 Tax=Streptomyces sp. OZ13 TaxID=3452210 RepID=UPI003F895493